MSVYDFETVSKSLDLLSSKKINYKFFIAGKGSSEEKFKEIFKKNKNVIFLGWISRKKAKSIVDQCHIGISPFQNILNYKLNLPNKYIDYMSLGLPIVSPLDGKVRKLIKDHNIGWNYKSNNVEDLTNTLIKIMNSPNELKIRSENSYNLYKNNYKFEIVYEKLVSKLENIYLKSTEKK